MAYVTVVNPLILSQAGVPFEQSFTATIIAAVIGTLLMGLALPDRCGAGDGLECLLHLFRSSRTCRTWVY